MRRKQMWSTSNLNVKVALQCHEASGVYVFRGSWRSESFNGEIDEGKHTRFWTANGPDEQSSYGGTMKRLHSKKTERLVYETWSTCQVNTLWQRYGQLGLFPLHVSFDLKMFHLEIGLPRVQFCVMLLSY